MKRHLFTILGLIILANLFSFAITPQIATASDDIGDLIQKQLDPVEDVYSPNEEVDSQTFSKAISEIIKTVLGFLGILFIILTLYAGFMWMTSAGNEEKITTAKKTLIAALIGVAIILMAYAITYFVIDQLLVATRGTGEGL